MCDCAKKQLIYRRGDQCVTTGSRGVNFSVQADGKASDMRYVIIIIIVIFFFPLKTSECKYKQTKNTQAQQNRQSELNRILRDNRRTFPEETFTFQTFFFLFFCFRQKWKKKRKEKGDEKKEKVQISNRPVGSAIVGVFEVSENRKATKG